MKFFLIAKTNARQEKVVRVDETHFVISVKALPENGKANEAIRRLLARHLHIPVSRLSLRSGATGKHKVFELE